MLKPRQDYMLVKPIARTHSAVLEVVTHEKHCRGEVIAVGPGTRDKKGNLRPLDTRVGDIVAFGDGRLDLWPIYRDTPEGEPYRVIQEADVCYIEAT